MTPGFRLAACRRRATQGCRWLVLFDFLDLGVNDIVVGWFGLCLLGACRSSAAGSSLRCLHIGIHFFAQLLAGFHQGRVLRFNGGFVFALECFFHVLDGGLDFFLLASFQLVAILAQRFFYAVHHGFGAVLGLHEFDFFLVVFGVQFGVFHHLLDLCLGQARVGLDGDLVFLAGALVFGAHMQNAVGVNVERHFNLRCAAC